MDQEELEAASRLVGTTLKDKYRLEGVLGIGGMGVVYRGSHRNGNRVAVKIMHPHLSIRTEIRTRFLKEGYTANSVDHDGVVRVLDDDIADNGAAFLVMELLTGETVDGRWERGERRMPLPAVCDIAGQLLDVLAAAHAKGIIHRDLKPENLFITKSGALKVLDFGIARVLDDVNFHMKTRTGTLLGTPAFMPPEQALGRVNEIDGRTDLWAVGATMFTLLTGAFVHEADNLEMLRIMAATQPARAIRSVAPAVPEQIAAVIDKALAFDMGARWANAKAMQEALASAQKAVVDSAPAPATSATNPAIMAAIAATEAFVPEPSVPTKATSTTAGMSHSADPLPAATNPTAPTRPQSNGSWTSSGYVRAGGVLGLLMIVGGAAFAKVHWSGTSANNGAALVSADNAMSAVQVAPPPPSATTIVPSGVTAPSAAAATASVAAVGTDEGAQLKVGPRHPPSPGGQAAKAPVPMSAAPSVAAGNTTPTPSATAVPAPSAAPKCEIVYDIDSSGNKVFKKVCK